MNPWAGAFTGQRGVPATIRKGPNATMALMAQVAALAPIAPGAPGQG